MNDQISDFFEIIAGIYDADPEREWKRAERHSTGYAVTWLTMVDHLSPPPARLLGC